MSRTARAKPRDLASGWPDVPTGNPVAEVARLYAINLREAIGESSIRSAADAAGVHHSTLLGILSGRTWADLESLARIGLSLRIWPETPK